MKKRSAFLSSILIALCVFTVGATTVIINGVPFDTFQRAIFPHSTTLPSSCQTGEIYIDTDATSGQQIYGCESGSFVLQGGGGGSTGDLTFSGLAMISATDMTLKTNTTDNAIVMNQSASVELYYNNAKKFETTSTGSQVTGDLIVTGVPAFSQGHIYGLVLSNGTDADHDIDIAAGEARDGANSVNMLTSSSITKQLDATWAAGTNAGGLADGLSIANDTWYHVFMLSTAAGTSEDFGFDTSVTAANLLADSAVSAASLTKYRRIGSILTDGSANILAFSQRGDEFLWPVPVRNQDSDPGITAVLKTLLVPLGIKVNVIALVHGNDTTPVDNTFFLITSPDQTDTAPDATHFDMALTASNKKSSIIIRKRTNTSSQVRYRLDETAADISISFQVMGWIDDRGRL